MMNEEGTKIARFIYSPLERLEMMTTKFLSAFCILPSAFTNIPARCPPSI